MVIGCEAVLYLNEDYQDFAVEYQEMVTPPYRFALGPDADQKAGYSGGGGTFIEVPSFSFDAVLGESEYQTTTFFLQYVQQCFLYGGFSGFHYAPVEAERAQTELKFLTNGLLPLL